VRQDLDEKYAVRETILRNGREIIRGSANAIRALHRGEHDRARTLMAEVGRLVVATETTLGSHQELRASGFFYDAVKEYAEARLTAALLWGEPLPLPAELHVDTVPFLKGLGEAVGELRRRLLDLLRGGDLAGAEHTFVAMETILELLTSLDYPDGMTAGLRRTTDVARSLIERSRADLTTAVVQERLRRELAGDR